MTTPQTAAPSLDPLAVLRGFASLRRLAGSYPAGHPSIAQKLKEIEDAIAAHLRGTPELRIDIIHGNVYVDGVSFTRDTQSHTSIIKELSDLGVDSIYIREGVRSEELLAVAELLWRRDPSSTESIESQLAARDVRCVSLGRLVPLDTRWRAQKWPDAPT